MNLKKNLYFLYRYFYIKMQQISEERIGRIGLTNLRNTCFMNTTLQCLINLDSLTNYILTNQYLQPLDSNEKINEIKTRYIKEYELVKNYIQLTKVIWTIRDRNVIEPSIFHASFQKMNGFDGFEQRDAEEALITIMDSIHEVLSFPITVNIKGDSENNMDELMIEAYKNWTNFNNKRYSIITELFSGLYMNQILSKENEDKNNILSRTFEKFDRIHLAISGNTLYECFHHYFNTEILDDLYKDEKNNRQVRAAKQVRFMLLPKYLIIVLKRFERNGMMTQKINTMVSFPLDNLDLSSYTIGYDKYDSSYRLRSIGCHMGSVNGGHYNAVCRGRDNKWYLFDDSSVSEYNIRSEIPMLQSKAYMLIYERNEGTD